MEVLPKRFGRFGLTLHPDKTRLIPFRNPQAGARRGEPVRRPPATFDLLGFTHYWGCARTGRWVIKRKTAKSRLSRTLRAIAQGCQRNRHEPIREQHQTLSQKLNGHYAYYGITGNARALADLRLAVVRTWRKWLARRKRGGSYPWSRFASLLEFFPLPAARVVHSVYRAQRNC